jgi:hypothetical protein
MRQTKEQSLMTDMTVARSILDQLGGARFVALTGAREFVGSHRQPDFQDRRQPEARQPSAPDAHAADLYSVTFFRIARRSKATSIATCSKQCFPSAPASARNCCGGPPARPFR